LSFWGTALTVLAKDLKIEIRTKEIVLSTALFALLVVLLCAFAFGLNTVPRLEAATGVLWIAVAFSGVLALGRTFLREREQNVWNAVLMTPAPRAAVYLGKLLGVALFLIIVELVLMPFIQVFFRAPFLENLHLLAPVLLLATLGYAAIGTLFGAMTIRTRLRDILLGVILFPLIAPILIATQKASFEILDGQSLKAVLDYIELLVVIDVIYLIGGLWLFGPLMDD
jgi:heme exporter protein B